MILVDIIKNAFVEQIIDYSPTKPFYSFSDHMQTFFIVSELGTLVYCSTSHRDISRFRDKFINRFDSLCKKHEMGEKITRELFRFYKSAMDFDGVKYRANLRTRMRLKLGIF